jgi:hypothetical protein
LARPASTASPSVSSDIRVPRYGRGYTSLAVAAAGG